MNIENICIIGAGISGLVAAKTFLEEGYKVTVFEKQKGLGGVWESSRTYIGLTTQSPRDKYAFTDYPMPASYPEWPTAKQMRDYLQSYAQHFGVLPKIRFNTEVTKVERDSNGESWIVSVGLNKSNRRIIEQEKYDFVIVCNGIFNIPNIPNLPGQKQFIDGGGKLLHSTQIKDISLIQDKRIVVVGFGKSAIDIAILGATSASKCILLVRKIKWMIPRFFLGIINNKYVLMSPLAESLFPYRKLHGMEKLLHTFGKPFLSLFWKIIEIILSLQSRLNYCDMLPTKPLNESVNCTSLVAPQNFYKYVRSNKIKVVKSEISSFYSSGVELTDGERLQADVVVFGTGYHQEMKFLEDKYRRLLIDDLGNFHLYRNLIHPDIPQMGFVGYNSSWFCQLTSEIGSWWLVDYVKKQLILPSRLEMIKQIDKNFYWRQSQSFLDKDNGTCVAPFHFHYLEELMQDMGDSIHGQRWNEILNIFMPINPRIYNNRRQKLKTKHYLSSNKYEDKKTIKAGIN